MYITRSRVFICISPFLPSMLYFKGSQCAMSLLLHFSSRVKDGIMSFLACRLKLDCTGLRNSGNQSRSYMFALLFLFFVDNTA